MTQTIVATAVTPSAQYRFFPRKHTVVGVGVSEATYESATEAVVSSARARKPMVLAATSVHGMSLAARDEGFRRALNTFDVVSPDGQPVRWALNLLHGLKLQDRVYGPNLMLRICEAAEREGVSVYLYGSTPGVLARLVHNLHERCPDLRIVGHYSPPFRPLTLQEDQGEVEDIRASGAGIVFVGLGCPRQERWAYAHRDRLDAALVCVGAAFDFHAGSLSQAPPWMQDRGLEWLYRVTQEPGRLWKRYAIAIPVFVGLVAKQLMLRNVDRVRVQSQLPVSTSSTPSAEGFVNTPR